MFCWMEIDTLRIDKKYSVPPKVNYDKSPIGFQIAFRTMFSKDLTMKLFSKFKFQNNF